MLHKDSIKDTKISVTYLPRIKRATGLLLTARTQLVHWNCGQHCSLFGLHSLYWVCQALSDEIYVTNTAVDMLQFLLICFGNLRRQSDTYCTNCEGSWCKFVIFGKINTFSLIWFECWYLSHSCFCVAAHYKVNSRSLQIITDNNDP